MPTNSYVDLESGTAPDQLIYDDSQVTTREIMIPAGQTIERGDILYLAGDGMSISTPEAGATNEGDGTFTATFDAASVDTTVETIVAEYGAAGWTFTGSESGELAADQATGLNIDIGPAIIDIVAGDTAFAIGDTFTFTIARGGNIVARKATAITQIDTNGEGACIAAVDVTVAADTPPAPSFAYVQGVFNSRQIGNLQAVAGGDGFDTETVISTLQSKGIIVKEAQL